MEIKNYKRNLIGCLFLGIGIGVLMPLLFQKSGVDFSHYFKMMTSKSEGDSPQDKFLKVYFLLQDAESLQKTGMNVESLEQYKKCLMGLEELKENHPNWEPVIVKFRLKYVREKIDSISIGLVDPKK